MIAACNLEDQDYKKSSFRALGPALGAVVAMAAPFGIYLRTLCPTVYSLDSAELTVAAYSLGIAHPTGYPTYLLFGYFFTHLPILNVGFRANLMSAFFASAAALTIYLVLLGIVNRVSIALGAALFLTFSYFYWGAAVVAEVYALHAFFIAILLLIMLPSARKDRPFRLTVAAFIFGTSLGNHMSTLLLAPGLLVLALWPSPREVLRPRLVALCTLSLLVGASVYLYLPLRYNATVGPSMVGSYDASGAFVPVHLSSVEGMGWMLAANAFRWMMFAYDPAALAGELARYFGWLFGNFMGLGVALGIVGVLEMLKSRRRESIALMLMFLANVAFFADYAAVDKSTMFIPTYVIWSIWIGVGALALARSVDSVGSELARPWRILSRHLAGWFLVAVAMGTLLVNFSLVDLSDEWRTINEAQQVMADVESNALVLGDWADIGPLEYLQVVEKMRLDVQIVGKMQVAPKDMRSFINRAKANRPVYWLGDNPPTGIEASTMDLADGYRLY